MNSKSMLSEELKQFAIRKAKPSLRTQFSDVLGYFIHQIVQVLSSSNEIRVREIQTKNGSILFSAYDPITHQQIHAVSEAYLRIWIEERWHR